MAPRTKKAGDAIDKRRPRQHIILQTLPPIVLSTPPIVLYTPTNTVTIRFAMSTADVKPGRPHSLVSSSSSSLPAQTPPSTEGDRNSRLSSDTFGVCTDGQHPEYAKAEEVRQAVKRLDACIDNEGASIRLEVQVAKDDLCSEIKHQGDKLEAQIDNIIKSILPRNLIDIDCRFDDLEKTIDKNFQAVDRWFNRLEDAMKDMQDDIHSIVQMLRMQQGVPIQLPPLIVEHPPSTHSCNAASSDARSLTSLDYASDISQRSAAGPSSPRHGQEVSAEADDDDLSLSSSKRQVGQQLFRKIRRMASRGNAILSSKKRKGKGTQ